MGAAMSAALSQGLASSRSDGVSSVKVEVFRCKEDSRTKVLDAIQLARTTAELRGFGEAFNESVMAKLLPVKYDKTLDPSDPGNVMKLKAMKANDDGMAWLRMSFPLSQHQHAIDKSRTSEYPNGVAYMAIKHLMARVIPAPEMAASILQTELESVTMKESDDPLTVDNKFNSISRLFASSGHTLTDSAKKTQLMKILPAVYTDCVTVANSQAQQQAQLVAYNRLLNAM